MELLGIERWEPPLDPTVMTGGESESPPYKLPLPVYDLENARKYPHKLAGRLVMITEKIHGTNARYVYCSSEERMYCGSRREWKKEGNNCYWQALRENPWIEAWCRRWPDVILWGEVFGWVQDLRYGAQPGQVFFRAFDAYWVGLGAFWSPAELAAHLTQEQLVPRLWWGVCPSFAELEAWADGESELARHMMEGIVIEVCGKQEWDKDLQAWRIKLKLPGNRYLARN
jgi:RNA ligase (TIGR02306 family)